MKIVKTQPAKPGQKVTVTDEAGNTYQAIAATEIVEDTAIAARVDGQIKVVGNSNQVKGRKTELNRHQRKKKEELTATIKILSYEGNDFYVSGFQRPKLIQTINGETVKDAQITSIGKKDWTAIVHATQQSTSTAWHKEWWGNQNRFYMVDSDDNTNVIERGDGRYFDLLELSGNGASIRSDLYWTQPYDFVNQNAATTSYGGLDFLQFNSSTLPNTSGLTFLTNSFWQVVWCDDLVLGGENNFTYCGGADWVIDNLFNILNLPSNTHEIIKSKFDNFAKNGNFNQATQASGSLFDRFKIRASTVQMRELWRNANYGLFYVLDDYFYDVIAYFNPTGGFDPSFAPPGWVFYENVPSLFSSPLTRGTIRTTGGVQPILATPLSPCLGYYSNYNYSHVWIIETRTQTGGNTIRSLASNIININKRESFSGKKTIYWIRNQEIEEIDISFVQNFNSLGYNTFRSIDVSPNKSKSFAHNYFDLDETVIFEGCEFQILSKLLTVRNPPSHNRAYKMILPRFFFQGENSAIVEVLYLDRIVSGQITVVGGSTFDSLLSGTGTELSGSGSIEYYLCQNGTKTLITGYSDLGETKTIYLADILEKFNQSPITVTIGGLGLNSFDTLKGNKIYRVNKDDLRKDRVRVNIYAIASNGLITKTSKRVYNKYSPIGTIVSASYTD